MGSRDSTVVRALVFHQCGLGSMPGPRVSYVARVCPPSTKTNTSKFQSDQEFEGHRFVSRKYCYVLPSLKKDNLFIYFILGAVPPPPCYRNWDKLRPDGLLASKAYFTLFNYVQLHTCVNNLKTSKGNKNWFKKIKGKIAVFD